MMWCDTCLDKTVRTDEVVMMVSFPANRVHLLCLFVTDNTSILLMFVQLKSIANSKRPASAKDTLRLHRHQKF